jgi:geranylgeranyl diphosphate synthase type I
MGEDALRFLEENRELIDSAMRKYLPERLSNEYLEWAFGPPGYAYDVDAADRALAEPVRELLSRGGKRWRPGLFLLIAEVLGGNPRELAEFSIIPELAHNGSLIVDDIEDGGELRRGKPCIHRMFGEDVAINAGNFLYFLPALVLVKNRGRVSDSVLLAAYEVFSQEMLNIHVGQAMDILWHRGGAENITEEQYMQMCAYKTGTLSRMAARMAAVLSGGSEAQARSLGRLAEAVGVAFQIQDDVLDITSSGRDRERFGKAPGNDIREGKRTLMVIHCLGKAPPQDRRRLLDILDSPEKTPRMVDEAAEMIRDTGSIEYARRKSRSLLEEAWRDAEPSLPRTPAREKLKSFVSFLIERDF